VIGVRIREAAILAKAMQLEMPWVRYIRVGFELWGAYCTNFPQSLYLRTYFWCGAVWLAKLNKFFGASWLFGGY
jgi:hypothetical protein